MTKVEAIKKVLENNNGTATWEIIYKNISKYYPSIKSSNNWQEGIRGVLYRELKNNKNFKKISLGIYALKDYKEENKKAIIENKIRMHSYIEGICIELGNFEKFLTYTADPSARYKDNIYLKDIISLNEIPLFTYNEIIDSVKRIDVLWFNRKSYKFPKIAYEVIDSIGTLENAFSRTFQLSDFATKFFLIGKKEFRKKFNKIVNTKPFNEMPNRYNFKSYEEIIDFYEKKVEIEKIKFY